MSSILRLNMLELESKIRIAARWKANIRLLLAGVGMILSTYVKAKCAYLQEMKQGLKASLWATITRWQYLLKMKAKYAGKR